MSNPTIPEMRQAIYDCIQPILAPKNIAVIKHLRDDPIPPAAVIINPRIAFPDNSSVGIMEWSIRLYETRKASEATSASFDSLLGELLLPLGKGMKIGFVLERVENVILDAMGFPLPGYIIVGRIPLANC